MLSSASISEVFHLFVKGEKQCQTGPNKSVDIIQVFHIDTSNSSHINHPMIRWDHRVRII